MSISFGARYAEEMLPALNQRRASGLFRSPPARWHGGLAAMALAHAREMALRGKLDHRSADGSQPQDRASRLRLSNVYHGEVIAWNYRDAASTVAGWSWSWRHWRIVNRYDSNLAGAAVAYSAKDEPYWCLVMGRK